MSRLEMITSIEPELFFKRLLLRPILREVAPENAYANDVIHYHVRQ